MDVLKSSPKITYLVRRPSEFNGAFFQVEKRRLALLKWNYMHTDLGEIGHSGVEFTSECRIEMIYNLIYN